MRVARVTTIPSPHCQGSENAVRYNACILTKRVVRVEIRCLEPVFRVDSASEPPDPTFLTNHISSAQDSRSPRSGSIIALTERPAVTGWGGTGRASQATVANYALVVECISPRTASKASAVRMLPFLGLYGGSLRARPPGFMRPSCSRARGYRGAHSGSRQGTTFSGARHPTKPVFLFGCLGTPSRYLRAQERVQEPGGAV